MSRPTAEIKQDIDKVLPDCKARLAAIPNDGDIASANERERMFHLRRVLNAAITGMTSPLEGRLAKLDARLADRKNKEAKRTACRIDLEKALQAVEGGSADFRLVDALRLSLRILRDGSEVESEEMFAPPLISWLHKNGIRPEHGSHSYVGALGSQVAGEGELVELEKERDEIIARVEGALAEAKNVLASLAAPVEVA